MTDNQARGVDDGSEHENRVLAEAHAQGHVSVNWDEPPYRVTIASQMADIGEADTLKRLQESGYWQAAERFGSEPMNYAYPVSDWEDTLEQIEPVMTGSYMQGFISRAELAKGFEALDRLEDGDEFDLEIGNARFIIKEIAPGESHDLTDRYDFTQRPEQHGLTP